MTYFRYLYQKTKHDQKKELYSMKFDEHQTKCIAIRNKIDTFILDARNNFQCSKVINNTI